MYGNMMLIDAQHQLECSEDGIPMASPFFGVSNSIPYELLPGPCADISNCPGHCGSTPERSRHTAGRLGHNRRPDRTWYERDFQTLVASQHGYGLWVFRR